LRITDTIDAFARIKLETTQADGNFWDIAAAGNDDFSKFNVLYKNKNAQFDLLSIDGESGLFSQRATNTTVGKNFYSGINTFADFTGFTSMNYCILAADLNGGIRFGTGGVYRCAINAQGFLGLNTLNPAVELDITTPDPDDGSVVHLSNSDQTHFLRFFIDRLNLSDPIIYWKHGDALQVGLANSDDCNYQPFFKLDGKTIGILNTEGSILIGEGAGEQALLTPSRPNLAIGRAALKNSINRNQLFAIGDSTLVNRSGIS
jgi:hypothetical protein